MVLRCGGCPQPPNRHTSGSQHSSSILGGRDGGGTPLYRGDVGSHF
jgi:hypothetical protein